MSDGKTITRELAIDALSALAAADRLISAKLHTANEFRADTIRKMMDQLDVTFKEDV